MKLIPISTRTFRPPKDDIFPDLPKVLAGLKEEDIVLITSKIISINEGRCVPVLKSNKEGLVIEESEYFYKIPETGRILTVTNNALISASGIDESNANGYYILLPKDSYKSAKDIHRYLTEMFNIKKLGIVITDSHSVPLRYGALSISVGSWGIAPIEYHTGKKDLFGRNLIYSKTNVIDSLAASTTLVSGECAESVPIVIARDVPNISFIDEDPRKELFVEMKDDLYKSLFDQFKKGGRNTNAQA